MLEFVRLLDLVCPKFWKQIEEEKALNVIKPDSSVNLRYIVKILLDI